MGIFIVGSYAKALVMTVERIPLVGETLIGDGFRQTFGGKGSDMAVQAARLGASVSYAGVIGNDAFGHEFIELMKQEGIDITAVRVTAELATGAGFIIKDKAARNVIVVDMGANKLFCETDIDRIASGLVKADVVLTQLEIPLKTALYALKKAKQAGKTTILNIAPAQDMRGRDLSFVDYMTPNETEARIAVGLPPDSPVSDEEIAEKLMETGCGAVIMTLGEAGAKIFAKDNTIVVAPCPVDVVDSNGAGDSFNAALAVALSEGKSIGDAAFFANATAALCCTGWETVPSYRTRSEVEEFIARSR